MNFGNFADNALITIGEACLCLGLTFAEADCQLMNATPPAAPQEEVPTAIDAGVPMPPLQQAPVETPESRCRTLFNAIINGTSLSRSVAVRIKVERGDIKTKLIAEASDGAKTAC